MRTKFKNANSVFTIVGIIFSVIGIIFLALGIITLVNHESFMNNAVQTEAEIIRVESGYDENRTERDIWVSYEVNGRIFKENLGYYTSGMSEGDKISVYYNPENPSELSSSSVIPELIFVVIGGVFAIFGLVFIGVTILSVNRRKKLMQTGDKLTGIITDVVVNNAVRINGHHPFKAECEIINPFDGEKYLYSSENVTFNISELIGSEVTVYVDRNNKKRSYVDIFELIDKYRSEENVHDYR